MPTRTADAEWRGDLRGGAGTMKLPSGAYQGPYTFASRFEEGQGSNPEELIAAAHAGCFSMAFSNGLAQAGFTPTRVHTTARVTVIAGQGITKIELDTEGEVPGIDAAKFQELAEAAKQNCPVSKALASVPEIQLNAKLVS
jgi:osmotically inducible protein OsmC